MISLFAMGESDVQSQLPCEVSEQAKLDDVKTELENVRVEKQQLRDEVASLKERLAQKEADLQNVQNKADKLSQSPLFVGTVQDITDRGAIVKQHGTNQESLTELTDDLREKLEPNDRVCINNNLSVVDRLPSETDARARMMETTESPDVGYSDIGGVEDQVKEVRETLELPMTEPELFDSVGVNPPSGVLLHGPPGTGKTMMAKAVANKTDATFIKMAGSELVHKFIGEGPKMVRDIFEMARDNQPAVLFIDEIDAIASRRTDSKTSGDAEVQRTMMQLLSEMDGFDERGDVRIIAATNRYDMLDDAILRPGRFDRIIEVPTPDLEGRKEIFNIHTRDMNVDSAVDLDGLAEDLCDVSGAEIEAICMEAGMFAIRDRRDTVTQDDFDSAIDKITDDESDEEYVSEVATTAFA